MLQKRRRSLLTLASYGTWDFDRTSFPYVYNSLLPNGSEVVKGKVAKIYANGVIENQLVPDNSNSASVYGYTTSITNGVVSITKDSSGDWGNLYGNDFGLKVVANHHYLFITNAPSYSNIVLNIFDGSSIVIQPSTIRIAQSNGSSNVQFRINSATSDTSWSVGATISFYANLVDLTLMFGTGNEPTTLTDNRIQNLLNRDYIAYNQGEYKGTNVGEIATEPYNLFDGELEQGGTNQGQPFSSTSNVRSKNFIKVIGGRAYTFEESATSNKWKNRYVVQYDANKNWIKDVGWGNSVGGFGIAYSGTLEKNCCYIKLKYYAEQTITPSDFYDICFHITGSRTGYAEHKPSASIPFIYQGNGALKAHDTLEITSSEYVFTKNVVETDLGNYNYNGSNGVFNCDLGNIKTQTNDVVVNALCPLYVPVTRNDFVNNAPNMTMRVDNNQSTPYLYFRNTTYTSSADFKTAMTGTKLRYQLATPQVIRIPRKHLGIVDLGTLTWTGGNQYGETQTDDLGGIIKPIPNGNTILNAYCFKYIMTYANTGYHSTTLDKIIYQWQESVATGGRIVILDTDFKGKTTQEIQALLSGTYLFYETAEEVDDIATRIFTENGGTITTDSEVLPNLDLDLPIKI